VSRLILNPVAGADEGASLVARINELLRPQAGDLDITITSGQGDAERAALRAAAGEETRIYVAGGDGTLNEVVNGVFASGRLADVVFGVLPIGTANDFAAVLGIPAEVDEAIRAFSAGHMIAVDVGCVNGRVFVNVSAGGFVAEASDAVTPGLKTVAGKLAYLLGGAEALWSYEPIAARIEPAPGSHRLNRSAPDRPGSMQAPDVSACEVPLYLFAVCNSPMIGGGRLIAPAAVVDDGWLDACVVEGMPTLDFVALLRQVAHGDHLDDPRVRYFRTRELRLSFEHAIKVNTDGEVLEAASCHYTLLPRGARFLVP